MTKEAHIAYHEDKINRLYEERDRIQENIHDYSKKGAHLRTDVLLMFATSLIRIDSDLNASINVRSSMMNLEK